MHRAVVALFVLAAVPVAAAPTDYADNALDAAAADLARCGDVSALAGHRVRVAVVLYPDGAAATAVGPWEPRPERASAAADSFERCLRDGITLRLAGAARHPGPSPRVVTRTIEIPGTEARVAAAVDEALAVARPNVAYCMGWPHDRRRTVVEATLHVEVAPDGPPRR
jgi:hypothetical protein